ncbi:YggT family protein [Candidatus Kaiserbacteria bacterium]|nr:YggT family protein [Candidatus Kaiserbacteria bacterium]
MVDIVYEHSRYWYYPSGVPALIVNWVVSIIEFLLAIRLLLVLFGASASSEFVAWFYGLTGRLVGPFFGAFPNLSLGGFVIELSTIFAMIGYAIIGWLIVQVLALVSSALARPL